MHNVANEGELKRGEALKWVFSIRDFCCAESTPIGISINGFIALFRAALKMDDLWSRTKGTPDCHQVGVPGAGRPHELFI